MDALYQFQEISHIVPRNPPLSRGTCRHVFSHATHGFSQQIQKVLNCMDRVLLAHETIPSSATVLARRCHSLSFLLPDGRRLAQRHIESVLYSTYSTVHYMRGDVTAAVAGARMRIVCKMLCDPTHTKTLKKKKPPAPTTAMRKIRTAYPPLLFTSQVGKDFFFTPSTCVL